MLIYDETITKQVKMPPSLLRFLMMNRSVTKVGVWTWRYLGAWVLTFLVHYFVVHRFGWWSVDQAEPFMIAWAFLSIGMLLLNRKDHSE
jgi:hypothetical protein